MSRFLLAGLLLLSGLAALAAPVGTVTRVQGQADALVAGALRPLAAGAAVEQGDTLRTATDARLEVKFLDDTVLTLGADTAIVVDEMVYDPAARTGRGLLDVAQGAFLLASGAIAKLEGRPLSVRTPLATIGIRGTAFWGGPLAVVPAGDKGGGGSVNPFTYEPEVSTRRADDRGYAILLQEGLITVTTPAGGVDMEPGQGTAIAAPGAAPSAPARWSAERVKKAYSTVEFR